MPPTLSALYTYPIKSCGCLSHTALELDKRGLTGDRRWMVVDNDGLFVTQREQPILATIQPGFKEGYLSLNAPGMNEFCLPLENQPKPQKQVEVWGDVCEAWDEGSDAAEWLSSYLKTPVRLVKMTDDFVRAVDERYTRQAAQTGFSDGFPLLVLSEASLDELNRRLAERGKSQVPISRFRPNLVVAGCEAFVEDAWHTIKIGSVIVDVVKPCARCVTTTVDQSSGTIPEVGEPSATLATFRKQGTKVMFAQNAIHRMLGTFKVGQTIEIIN